MVLAIPKYRTGIARAGARQLAGTVQLTPVELLVGVYAVLPCSTLILAVSIPLAILSSVIVLSCLHQTINTMTLGGLALAVGILVDDATVTIENIERHFEEGAELHDGILGGAAQIAVPALVSTLCICIVFLPTFFLGGIAGYLFAPLGEAVIFAMLASYILSRTLVPTLAMYLLKAHQHGDAPSRNVFVRFQKGFDRLFEKIRSSYSSLLAQLVSVRLAFVPCFVIVCLLAWALVPFLGQNFFPATVGVNVILELPYLGCPARRDELLTFERSQHIIRGQTLGLHQARLESDHDMTKFASVRIGNRSARNSDQLCTEKVQRNVVQLGFGQTIPGKGELQNRNGGRVVIDDQRWERSGG